MSYTYEEINLLKNEISNNIANLKLFIKALENVKKVSRMALDRNAFEFDDDEFAIFDFYINKARLFDVAEKFSDSLVTNEQYSFYDDLISSLEIARCYDGQ